MHFCSTLIVLILSLFELLFITLDWNRALALNNNQATPFIVVSFVMMGVYYTLSAIYGYRAYAHFKALYVA